MTGLGPARKGERREVLTAFVTLFALIASHSILETARDALFLAKVAATNLPWVYLAIAALSLLMTKPIARLTARSSPRRVLTAVSLLAAGITLGFFALHQRLGTSGFYALYVWSGLLMTLLLVHLWDLLGARFTITQAKRLYGFIGAGGVAGAIAGSGTAGLLSRFMAPEKLVLVAAIGFALGGLLSLGFTEQPPAAETADSGPNLSDSFGIVARDPYARQLVATLFVATVCLTVSDFVFKSSVAQIVPRKDLATFLGTVYFGCNILSLIAQLWVVGWMLKRVSLGAALGVLPALLVATGLGVAVSTALAAVILLKVVDGSLRYSLHSTTAELLFFPFGGQRDTGRRVKAAADLVAQRGGQVLASLAILGLNAAHTDPHRMALGLVFLACGWVGGALALRKPYVAVFRARSRAARRNQINEFPELDVASLETLLGALESDKDREVLAALGVLERENKAHLVPALLLHHPSEPVVLRVLGILAESNRKSAIPIINRIAGHPSPNVRAAALATRSVLDGDREKLRGLLATEESQEAREAILVNLVVSGAFEDEERRQHTAALLGDGAPATKVAFAEAIGRRAAPGFDEVLRALLTAHDGQVRRAAVAAMGSARSPSLLLDLAGALADEVTRGAAEHALAAYGDEAFEVLRIRLEETSTKASLRWRIPAAMALCNWQKTMETLVGWLSREPDASVRFSMIRTLERIVRRNPTFAIDKRALLESIRGTIGRAYWYLDMRQQLARGAAQDDARRTPGHELLSDLLRDKESSARALLFRLLGLLHSSEDLMQVYRGLGVSKELRATSMELIENILREPVRTAVLGLVDDCADALRLPRGGAFHRPKRFEYGDLLAHLEASDSDEVPEVTRFHSTELASASRSTDRAAEVA